MFASQSYGTIVAKHNWVGYRSLLIFMDDTDLRVVVYGPAWVGILRKNDVSLQEWSHFCFTYSSDLLLQLYVNGTLVDSDYASAPMQDNPEPVYIGNALNTGGGSNNHFRGAMDELRIWNHVRTQDQLLTLMHQPLSGNETGLLLYYRFREGSGSTIADLGPGSHDATFVGSPTWLTSDAPSALVSGTMANFTVDHRSGSSSVAYSFSDLSISQESITAWEWDFDNDGNVDSYEQNPTWIYGTSGLQTVNLRVLTANTEDTETKADYIIDALVAWYRFTGNSQDESRNGNDGLEQNAAHSMDRFGQAGKALRLDGTTQVDCGNQTSLDLQDSGAITCWMKAGVNGDGIVLAKESAAYYAIEVQASASQILTTIGGIPVVTPVTMSDEWVFYCCNFDADQDFLRVYLDGVLQSETAFSSSIGQSPGNLFLGRQETGGPWYTGDLDDFRIYNRFLDLTQIADLFTETPLADPEGIQVVLTGASQFLLSWNPVVGAISYSVYNSEQVDAPSNQWTLVASGLSTPYWNGTVSGTAQYYYVTAR